MLEDRPILKDRLAGAAVFGGIGIAAIAGFELVIGGGFDFLTPGREVREIAPSAYAIVHDDFWSSDARVVRLTSTEPLFAAEEVETAADQLAGGPDDETAPDGPRYPETTEADIYRDIQALYEHQDYPEQTPLVIENAAPAADEPSVEDYEIRDPDLGEAAAIKDKPGGAF
jgi:hypothetical protein